MAAIDLLFTTAPIASPGPVELVFGDEDETPSIAPVTLEGGGVLSGLRGHARLHLASTLHASGSLSGLRGHAVLHLGTVLHGTGRLSGLRGRMALAYNVNVERPLVGRTEHRAQPAQIIAVPQSVRLEQTGQLSASVLSHQQPAQAWGSPIDGRWQDSQRLRHPTQVHAQQAQRANYPTAQQWQDTVALRAAAWQYVRQARRLHRNASQGFEDAQRLRHAVVNASQQAYRLHQPVQRHTGPARQWALALSDHAQQATRPRPGVRPAVVPPSPPPCYVPQLPLELLFTDVADSTLPLHLLFTCASSAPPARVVIARRRAYIVINAITLHRLDTGAELHALGFSASLDYGSWTWQWSATLHESAEAHLDRQSNGAPPALLASINGQPLRLTLERIRLNQEFLPQKRFQVSGRGRAAILASPWAPTMQHGGQADARTAQQLAQEVLTMNGVGIGWNVDWQLPDWTVPAGLWAVQGSYIDALIDIAAAVGAYIQPHPTDAVLRILPKYPVPPWQWNSLTPDYELPLDAVQTLGTEFVDKPAYNGIDVGGVQAGVFGPVIRAGTVGDVSAPQVMHPLITDATAQRLRGIAELSDTGRQRRISLSMQVLPETGLIVPGKLLQVGSGSNAMRGLVRGTSIEWGRPKLRQNLELEVHA